MSHISIYSGIKVTDDNILILGQVLQNAGCMDFVTDSHVVKQFGRNSVKAKASFLIPGWRYKIAITEKGEFAYDHFGSKAGTMDAFRDIVHDFTVEAALDAATDFLADEGLDGIAYVEDAEDEEKEFVFE